MYTPENITELKPNQIFVFGSNMAGEHIGGAAKVAKEKFGAEDGVGEGLTGQCYAFPTLDRDFKKVGKEHLMASIICLLECAEQNPDKEFLVTKIGTGIAGFTLEEMKELFQGEKPNNIILPKEFS